MLGELWNARRLRGWLSGRMPRPWVLEITATPASASLRTASPQAKAPPPNHSSGRLACFSR